MEEANKINCPCCGHPNSITEYHYENTDTVDIRCDNNLCNREFSVLRKWESLYQAKEIKYTTCSCGQDVRLFGIKNEEYICPTCYSSGVIENVC